MASEFRSSRQWVVWGLLATPLLLAVLAASLLPVLWAVAVTAGVSVLLGGLAYRFRAAWLAERERAHVAERQVALMARAADHERDRLALFLQNGPVQDLLAASAFSTQPGVLDTHSATEVARALSRLADDLHPPALSPFGLSAALAAYLTRLEEAHPTIHFRIAVVGDDAALPQSTRRSLYRIAEEALTNAIRHGAPRTIDIDLAITSEHASLLIHDDGRGYAVPEDLTRFADEDRYGLLTIAVHVQLIGGILRLDGSEHGVRVAVDVSLSHPPPAAPGHAGSHPHPNRRRPPRVAPRHSRPS